MSDYKLYIDGELCEAASGESYATYNPATGEKIADVAKGSADDARRAIAAARRAFDEGPWPRMSGKERAEWLRKFAAGIQKRQAEFAKMEVLDSGATLRKANMVDVMGAVSTFNKFAEFAEKVPDYGELPPFIAGPKPAPNYTQYEPIGVCGAITPWNFPLIMAAWKIGPAIAAGNCVVLKPATITSITALMLGQVAAEIGLPRGVLNVVAGPGASVGEEISGNPMVDKVAFTGSTDVGSRIMQIAAKTVKKVTLELGGKSAALVTDNVNFDLAGRGVLWGTFFHNGQVCMSGTRALVYESVYDKFVEFLAEKARGLKHGDPLSFATDLGPLVSESQLKNVERYVQIGKDEGARLVCGGKRPEDPALSKGYYYEPTIFADVDNKMRIAQEEIFGPVLCVIKVKDDDDAIRVANDSIFGLAGTVWCEDIERAKKLAERMRTGTVWINDHHLLGPEQPFGGYKQSGFGREMGVHGYNEYRQLKRIHVDASGPDYRQHFTFKILHGEK